MPVTVLQQCFQQYCELQKSFDLAGLWASMDGQWKTAPKASMVLEYQDLFISLLLLCPHGVLSHKKTSNAILGLHELQPCLFGKATPILMANRLSGALRASLSKVRLLKVNQRQRQITLAKAHWGIV